MAVGCGTELGEAVPVDDGDIAQTASGIITSNPTTTNWSGNGGTRVVDLDRAVTTGDALVGVTAGERSDDPCFLKALFEDVDGGAASDRTYNNCDGAEGSLKTARLPDGYFVTGVRTCLNSAGDKVKGIQVLGKPLSCIRDPSSSVEEVVENCHSQIVGHLEFNHCDPFVITVPCSETELGPFFERTNCQGSNSGPDADWETIRRCPVGKVATSLTLHERDGGGNRDMFDGLRMVCNPVE
ncbi:MAG: hypothetical protein H6730_24010 [Deltaproteobacteria bacterium]|nr:hypothetical protein [Deltaproteobacteria bacterium]